MSEERSKSTAQDDLLISNPNADPGERASAMMRIAADGIVRLEPEIAALLSDAEPIVRDEAIGILVGWWRRMIKLGAGEERLGEGARLSCRPMGWRVDVRER